MKVVLDERLREAIARAIVDDEANLNGEHLFDGEELLFACPMQAPDASRLQAPMAPVRALLPAGARLPSFADYLAERLPGQDLRNLPPEERGTLLQRFEQELIARIGALLPAEVELGGGAASDSWSDYLT